MFPVTDWENIQSRQYPGYGCCIFCRATGTKLTKEHIIPFSLGAKTWIREATCSACQEDIKPVDTYLGRAVFGQYRIHSNIQTRRPKERPTKLPAEITVARGNLHLDLPIKDHPYALALPVWGEAGFLRAASIDEPFPTTLVHVYHHTPPNIRETLGIGAEEGYQIWAKTRIDGSLFARGIAKIAYCHAVTRFGLDGFRAGLLPNIILGKSPAVSYFVGGPLDNPPPPFSKNVLHAVNFQELTTNTGLLRVSLVQVRLFAHSSCGTHGLPIYHVIVGAPRLSKRSV